MVDSYMNAPSTPIINIGLMGFGWIAKVHANAYFNIPYAFPNPTVNARIQAVLRNKLDSDQDLIRNLNINLVYNKY